jgi:HEAT repeat protein
VLLAAAAAVPYGLRVKRDGWPALPRPVLIWVAPWQTLDPQSLEASMPYLKALAEAVQRPLPVWQQRLLVRRMLVCLKDKDPKQRGVAAVQLLMAATQGHNTEVLSGVPALLAAIDDPDPQAAYAIQGAVGRLAIGDTSLEPMWERLLAHGPTEEIRASAAASLGWLATVGDQRPLLALMRGLLDPSDEVRQQVAYALGRLENPAALPALIRACNDRGYGAQSGACVALWKLEGAAAPAVPALLGIVHRNSPAGGWAIIALGRIGPGAAEAVPDLVANLKNPTRTDRGRTESAIALGRIGVASPEVIEALRAGLTNAKPPIQRGCLEGLYRLGWKPMGDDRAKVEGFGSSTDGATRIWMRMILAHADGRLDEMVPELVGLLHGPDWWVSVAAVEALDSLGARAESALPALEPLRPVFPPDTSVVDDQVQQAAGPAVKHIKAAVAAREAAAKR